MTYEKQDDDCYICYALHYVTFRGIYEKIGFREDEGRMKLITIYKY